MRLYACVNDKLCVLVFCAWSVTSPHNVQVWEVASRCIKFGALFTNHWAVLYTPGSFCKFELPASGTSCHKRVAENPYEVRAGAPGSPYYAFAAACHPRGANIDQLLGHHFAS
jgi:hypothetical protein